MRANDAKTAQEKCDDEANDFSGAVHTAAAVIGAEQIKGPHGGNRQHHRHFEAHGALPPGQCSGKVWMQNSGTGDCPLGPTRVAGSYRRLTPIPRGYRDVIAATDWND